MSKEEAQELIDEAKERVRDGEDPEEISHDDFGLTSAPCTAPSIIHNKAKEK